MPALAFDEIGKAYGGRTILERVTLSVEIGDLMVVCGPPASGKSVLVRLLMGLEKSTAGRILLRGKDVTDVPAAERNIGYVPQSFALYPHLSVHDNIAYPLKLAGVKRSESEPIVSHVAEMLKIADLLGKRPDQLSGGQKQRVAIARGIAKQTEIYVLDDPLTGLDFKLREQLVDDLKDLQQAWQATFLYTTSDPIETLTLADRVGILADGTIVEVGEPEQLYVDPDDQRTMALLGFPPANLLSGRLLSRDGQAICDVGLFEVPALLVDGAHPVETEVSVGIRPESVLIGDADVGDPGWPCFQVGVLLREDLGGEEIVYLDADGTPLTSVARHGADGVARDATTLRATVQPTDVVIFASDGTRIGRGMAVSDG